MIRRLLVAVVIASAVGGCSSHEAGSAELRWIRAASLPTPRTELGVAALEGKVYAAGGFVASGAPSAIVEVYDPARDVWRPAPSLPSPRHHAALVGAAGRLYIVGGYDATGKPLSETASWGPGEKSWRREADMPTPRGALAAAAVSSGGRAVIHAVSGASRFGADAALTDAHEVFDPATGRWARAEPARARDHLAAAGVRGALYVCGGRELSLTKNLRWLDIVDRRGAWRSAPPMPTARGGLAAAGAGGRVFFFGGEQPSGTFDAAEFYDIATAKWFSGSKMPTARHGLGAAAIGNRLYVVGGGPTPGLSVSGATEVLVIR